MTTFMATKSVGVLNVWFEDRGFGFIHQDQNGELVRHFLHISNVRSGTPVTGATVRFLPVAGKKGLFALHAEVLTEVSK